MTLRPGTFFNVTLRPPNRLAEPGKICSVVTPPASAVTNPGSCGHTLCSAQTSAVLGAVASLPSECEGVPGDGYTPRCECTSMTPGVIQRPLASTIVAPSALRPLPTAWILPSLIRTSALSRRSPVPVSTVAPVSRVVSPGSGV